MSQSIQPNQLVTLFDDSLVRISEVLENGNFMVGNSIYTPEHLKKAEKKVDKKTIEPKS